MRFRPGSVILLATAALVAACGGDDRSGPTAIFAPNLSIAAACDPAGIRSTLAQLLDEGMARSQAIPAFNDGEQARRNGQLLVAQQSYARALQVLLTEYVADRTTSPKKYASTQDAVDYVVSSILRCGGTVLPDGLTSIVGDIGGATAGDQTLCAFAPGMPTDCRLPNVDVVVQAPAGFFSSLGVLSIQPTDEDDPFQSVYPGQRWSPVWRIRVLPITAQANYPYYSAGGAYPDAPATSFRASVAVCAADRPGEAGNIEHPPISQLVVSQAVELPPNQVVELPSDAAVAALLDCTEGSTNYAAARTSPFGSSRLAVAGWRLLRGAGTTIGDALLPQRAHAVSFVFDGGIGGKVIAFESWFAAVAPQTASLSLYYRPASQTSQALYLPIPTTGLVGSVGGIAYEVAAGVPGEGFSAATGCTYSTANPNVATVTSGGLLTFASAGTTTVSATCDEGTGSATVTAATLPPIG